MIDVEGIASDKRMLKVWRPLGIALPLMLIGIPALAVAEGANSYWSSFELVAATYGVMLVIGGLTTTVAAMWRAAQEQRSRQ